MTVANRISVSLSDDEFQLLDRLATHAQRSKAEIVRRIIKQHLCESPNAFRVPSRVKRTDHILTDQMERLRFLLAELSSCEQDLHKGDVTLAQKRIDEITSNLKLIISDASQTRPRS